MPANSGDYLTVRSSSLWLLFSSRTHWLHACKQSSQEDSSSCTSWLHACKWKPCICCLLSNLSLILSSLCVTGKGLARLADKSVWVKANSMKGLWAVFLHLIFFRGRAIKKKQRTRQKIPFFTHCKIMKLVPPPLSPPPGSKTCFRASVPLLSPTYTPLRAFLLLQGERHQMAYKKCARNASSLICPRQSVSSL